MGVDVAHLVRIAKPDISYLMIDRTISQWDSDGLFFCYPPPTPLWSGGASLESLSLWDEHVMSM